MSQIDTGKAIRSAPALTTRPNTTAKDSQATAERIPAQTQSTSGPTIMTTSPSPPQNNEAMGLIQERLQIAWVAMTLGLVDDAIFILQEAYTDVHADLYKLLSELDGKPPTKEQQAMISTLQLLQDKALSQAKTALGSQGGPQLSTEEVEALLITDQDMDPQGLDPNAAKILKSFNHNQSKEEVQKNVNSAVDKMAKKLPEVLLAVMDTLQNLMDNPSAGEGSAQIFVNAALSKLELAQAMVRMLSGSENTFKAAAVQSIDLSGFESQIQHLSTQANNTYRELQARGFVRGRSQGLSNMPTVEELEMMIKNPNAFQQKEKILNGNKINPPQTPVTRLPQTPSVVRSDNNQSHFAPTGLNTQV